MDMMQGIASSVKRICFVGRIITARIITLNPRERVERDVRTLCLNGNHRNS